MNDFLAPPRIVVLGLGPGDPDLLTVQAARTLADAERVWVRTMRHPTLDALRLDDKTSSFDSLYNTMESGEQVYWEIADRLVRAAQERPGTPVVYAVPGSPTAGERSVVLLRAMCAEAGVELVVLPAVSSVEATLVEIGVDVLADGLQIVDASELSHLHDVRPSVASQFLNPTQPLLLSGVWQHSIASAVKLFLLANYPPEHGVRLVRAGLGEPPVEVALEDLDRGVGVDHLTMLYLPPLPPDAPGASFYQLTHIMARLRGPGGCPWDREQSHRTIKRHLLEEAYEAIEALDNDDPAALEEELGDVLLQVSLHSEIAYTESDFDIGDVVRGLTAKLVRRHPHVFGAAAAETAADVLVNWQTIKQGERTERGDEDPSVLDGVPTALPALARAQALSLRASNAGFDWRESAEVWDKLHEELLELEEAGDFDRLEELGDLLFVVVNYARFYKLEAEEALRLANLKFDRRYRALEREVVARGALVSDVSSEDLDAIWNDVKIAERQSK